MYQSFSCKQLLPSSEAARCKFWTFYSCCSFMLLIKFGFAAKKKRGWGAATARDPPQSIHLYLGHLQVDPMHIRPTWQWQMHRAPPANRWPSASSWKRASMVFQQIYISQILVKATASHVYMQVTYNNINIYVSSESCVGHYIPHRGRRKPQLKKKTSLFMHISIHLLWSNSPTGAPKTWQKLDPTKHTGSVKNPEEKKHFHIDNTKYRLFQTSAWSKRR